jgi:tRNA-intron endonuclease
MKKKYDSEIEDDEDSNHEEELEDSEEEIDQISEQEIIIADGIFHDDKIYIEDPTAISGIYEKSFFGTINNNNTLELEILEALMLMERKRLHLYSESQEMITFEQLVEGASLKDERVWTKYLIYRDLRQRGYVVRMGYGDGLDFRVFPRGAIHQEEIAKYFICILAEGEPVQLETLDKITRQSVSARKELLLAIIDRLGDPTYYKLEQFKLMLNEKGKIPI